MMLYLIPMSVKPPVSNDAISSVNDAVSDTNGVKPPVSNDAISSVNDAVSDTNVC
jgi:hypothetical protein